MRHGGGTILHRALLFFCTLRWRGFILRAFLSHLRQTIVDVLVDTSGHSADDRVRAGAGATHHSRFP